MFKNSQNEYERMEVFFDVIARLQTNKKKIEWVLIKHDYLLIYW